VRINGGKRLKAGKELGKEMRFWQDDWCAMLAGGDISGRTME